MFRLCWSDSPEHRAQLAFTQEGDATGMFPCVLHKSEAAAGSLLYNYMIYRDTETISL